MIIWQYMEKLGGKEVVRCFKQYKYRNRLPRGKAYANTGKIHDIQFNGNIITGKVKDN